MTSVGVVGLGLIGGSLARDLARAGWRVLGDDRDAATLAAARSAGVILRPLEPRDLGSLDLLVLALPVRASIEWVRQAGGRIAAESPLVITDVGSTKASILAAADAAGLAGRFVGSHPMAGSHESGWSAARTGLFRDRPVWICPSSASAPAAVTEVERVWAAVGARTRRLDAAAHDRRLARTSHLPQLTATALAGVLARHQVAPDDLGPGGRDATRIAGSHPDMWTDIALDNRHHIAPALEELARDLAELAALVRSGDAPALHARLHAARTWSHGAPAPAP